MSIANKLGYLTCTGTTPAKDTDPAALGDGWYAPDRFEAVFQEPVEVEPFDVYSVPLSELPADFPGFLKERADAARTIPSVILEVQVINGRPRCNGMRLESTSRPIGSDDLRRISLPRMLDEALEQARFFFDGEALHFENPDVINDRFRRHAEAGIRSTAIRPRTRAITDDLLEEVTREYRKAMDDLIPPIRALAVHFGRPYETVRTWVQHARRRHKDAVERGEQNPERFLSPTTRGRKGG